MRVNLNVPFSEKDKAKALGAQWDTVSRTWYSDDTQNLARFRLWLSDESLTRALPQKESEAEIGISLSSFLNKVKQGFDQHCALSSWIKAEVVEFRDKDGHCYITLAEYNQDEITLERRELAKINCNLWKSRSKALQDKFYTSTGTVIKVGMKIMLLAKADYHTKYGVSLTILDIDPSFTLGDLEANLRKIRATLQSEGIYKRNKELPVPKEFTYIAVLAPADGAGLGDFKKEANLLDQYGLCKFDYYEALFQGQDAVETLISNLEKVRLKATLYDVIIIIRGGGAATDLAWLNNLSLARKICTLGVPVFSGIGHERDNTIIDEISCCRFDTPSKVSHYILNIICENARKAEENFVKISYSAQKTVQKINEKICSYAHTVKMSSQYLVDQTEQNLESFRKTLLAVRRTISSVEGLLIHNYDSLSSHSFRCIEHMIIMSKNVQDTILTRSLSLIQIKENELSFLYTKVKSLCSTKLQKAQSTINYLENIVLRSSCYQIELQGQKLTSNYATFKTKLSSTFDHMNYKLESYMRQILPQDPHKTLLRGFALVRNNRGKVVDSLTKAKGLSCLEIEFRDGALTVFNKHEEK